MTGNHIYAYGIIEAADLELDVDGVAGAERVYTLEHGPIAAVVSDIDSTDPKRTTANMEAHDEVLRRVMQEGEGRTVVPMSFGMAFKDERTLTNVLEGGRRAFETALDDVEGTVELGVKTVAEDQTVDRQSVAETVRERLEPHSVDVIENDLFSDRLVTNETYLVNRDDRTAFDETIGALEEELDGVLIQYTGPFAPYNFVDIEIGARQ